MPAPETCPNCGASVPRRAKACPECGSDDSTGWSDRATIQSLDIPDEDDFNYNEFVEREFGGKPPRRRGQTLWWLVAVGLLLMFVWMFFRR